MKYPEICLIAGTWMLVSQMIVAGWIFVGLSLFLAFARFSLQYNEKKEAEEKTTENIQQLVDNVTTILAGIGAINGKSEKTILH